MAIEDTFEICFEPEDESAIQSISDLSHSILRLVESRHEPKTLQDTLVQRLAALAQLEDTTGITFVDRKENEQHCTWARIWDRASEVPKHCNPTVSRKAIAWP